MTRRLGIVLRPVAVIVLTLAAAATALAHPGHEHKVLGTVTMAASDHVMLTNRDGKDVTVHITKDTKVIKNKKPAKVEDIQAGMRVVITAVMENAKMMAKTIELGAAPASK